MVIFIPRSLTPRFLLTRFKSFQNVIARGTVPLPSLPLRHLLSQLPPPHFPLPLLPRRPLPAGLSCHQGSEAALQPGQPHLSTLQGGKWASGTAGYAGAHRNEAWELLPGKMARILIHAVQVGLYFALSDLDSMKFQQ